jgi:hypothetical protein
MKILFTASSGLIGSEAVEYFDRRIHVVFGIDNNMRQEFFGSAGDTTRRLCHLQKLPGASPIWTWTFALGSRYLTSSRRTALTGSFIVPPNPRTTGRPIFLL